jgi:hypothetical protein
MSDLYAVKVEELEKVTTPSKELPVVEAIKTAAYFWRRHLKVKPRPPHPDKDPLGYVKAVVAGVKASPAPEEVVPRDPDGSFQQLEWMRELVLHTAHPKKFSPPRAMTRLKLRVTSIHPDAGMPAMSDNSANLGFAIRILATATRENWVTRNLPEWMERHVNGKGFVTTVRMTDRKAIKRPGMPGKFYEADLNLMVPAEICAHLKKGMSFSTLLLPPG